jgi:tRNA threonylcarbamoyladenosine modification (KEOPS) complex Cgi121 subunit
MELTFMRIYSIKGTHGISDYYVGINQIEIDPDEVRINDLVELIEIVQDLHKDTVLQFFNEKHILNIEHILHACYFVQKAFHIKANISNKKNLEFFLYLATKRQIKISLEDFGIIENNLRNKRVSYCIITPKNNIHQIQVEINKHLNFKELDLNFEDISEEKYKTIKNYFGFSDNQILVILKSYGINEIEVITNQVNLQSLFKVLNDLICERMVLLSLDKRSSYKS